MPTSFIAKSVMTPVDFRAKVDTSGRASFAGGLQPVRPQIAVLKDIVLEAGYGWPLF